MPRKLTWDPEATDFNAASTDINRVVQKLTGQQPPAIPTPVAVEMHNSATLAASLVATPVTLPAANTVTTITSIESLAALHTESEQKVYEAMYMETRKQGRMEWCFTFRVLTERSKLRNPRTLQTALNGLVAKLSIDRLTNDPGDHLGKRYRIYEPEEVLTRRQKASIEIDPQSKKVIT